MKTEFSTEGAALEKFLADRGVILRLDGVVGGRRPASADVWMEKSVLPSSGKDGPIVLSTKLEDLFEFKARPP